MLSRIKRLGIAPKLTLINAVMFSVVLFITSSLIMTGLYYSLVKQAETAMTFSLEALHDTVDNPDPELLASCQHATAKAWRSQGRPVKQEELTCETSGQPFFVNILQRKGILTPGVVMRVSRVQDNQLVFDNASNYPPTETIEDRVEEGRPLFGNALYAVSAVNENVILFIHRENISWGGEEYSVFLMRMITGERQFLSKLGRGLLGTDALGLLLALLLSHTTVRKALYPLAKISDQLQDIEVKQLNKRVTVPEADDETHSLAISINKTLDRLQDGLEREQRFVSDASHELRTPLSIITGHAGMLRRWGSEDPQMLEEGLATIYDEADRMSKLVQRLLELARADQKRLKLTPEVFDLCELVQRLHHELTPVVTEHQLVLAAEGEGYVQADPATIRELMLILIDNARKYTPEGGTVTLFCRQEGKEVHFGVTDTGVGISPENQAHIFDRFFRVDDARTRNTGGAGLGLALAEQLMLANGGRITVESQLGEGTTMHAYLPLLELE